MTELVLAVLFLVGGGLLMAYAYSSVMFEHPEQREARRARATPFTGFERRDETRQDRRRMTIGLLNLGERRHTGGRRVTDARAA